MSQALQTQTDANVDEMQADRPMSWVQTKGCNETAELADIDYMEEFGVFQAVVHASGISVTEALKR